MNELSSAQPLSWRRFLQFRLRSLLLLPVLVALCGYWYVQHRKAEAARADFRRATAFYDTSGGEVTALDLCEVSLRLCQAEEQVPFARSARARAQHFARVVHIENQARATIAVTLYGPDGLDTAREELVRIAEYRREALDSLDPP